MKSFLQLKLDMEVGIDGMLANETKKSTKLIKDLMLSVKDSELHSFSIPLLVDMNIGENWGELH